MTEELRRGHPNEDIDEAGQSHQLAVDNVPQLAFTDPDTGTEIGKFWFDDAARQWRFDGAMHHSAATFVAFALETFSTELEKRYGPKTIPQG